MFFSSGITKYETTFFCFDTIIELSLSGKNSDVACDEIKQTLTDMEKDFSKYIDGSTVSLFNSLPLGETVLVSDEMARLIQKSLNVSRKTNGAFDITTSALSDLWQIKTATVPPSQSDVDVTLEIVGYDKIALKGNQLTKSEVQIDFGGILKGMAADKVREIAKKYNIKSGIVNLGGNVCLIGFKNTSPWTVGVNNPFSPGEVYITIDAADTNVITSGAYQRYFEYDGKIYHHILNPETGYPAQGDIASVTIISDDGALADALSTAIYVAGSRDGLAIATEFGVEAVIIKKDGSVIATENVNYKKTGG